MSNFDDLLDLAVDAGAAARITRWIVADYGPPPWQDIKQDVRRRLRARGGHFDTWADGTECPNCVGIYAAAFVIVARRVAPRAWRPLAAWLACAELAAKSVTEH